MSGCFSVTYPILPHPSPERRAGGNAEPGDPDLNWKKLFHILKKTETPRPNVVVDIRTAFRVEPSPEAPILLIVHRNPVQVVDISSGGVSFKNKNFMVGVFYRVNFILPHNKQEISSQLEIMSIDRNRICRCRFTGLTSEQEEHIHQYVVERKKELLASAKGRPALQHSERS